VRDVGKNIQWVIVYDVVRVGRKTRVRVNVKNSLVRCYVFKLWGELLRRSTRRHCIGASDRRSMDFAHRLGVNL